MALEWRSEGAQIVGGWWRVPFLAGIVVGYGGYHLQKKAKASPAFEQLRDGELAHLQRSVQQSPMRAALATRDGTRGYRDLDEAASRAGPGQLPDAVKTATLAGLLRAATSDKHRKVYKYRRPMTGTLKAQAVIREEVETRLEQILQIADNVWEWLKEDEESHNDGNVPVPVLASSPHLSYRSRI